MKKKFLAMALTGLLSMSLLAGCGSSDSANNSQDSTSSKYEKIDTAAAKKMVLQNDKKRASYYNYYSNKKWGDGATYDLCVNTGKVGIYGILNVDDHIFRNVCTLAL